MYRGDESKTPIFWVISGAENRIKKMTWRFANIALATFQKFVVDVISSGRFSVLGVLNSVCYFFFGNV